MKKFKAGNVISHIYPVSYTHLECETCREMYERMKAEMEGDASQTAGEPPEIDYLKKVKICIRGRACMWSHLNGFMPFT